MNAQHLTCTPKAKNILSPRLNDVGINLNVTLNCQNLFASVNISFTYSVSIRLYFIIMNSTKNCIEFSFWKSGIKPKHMKYLFNY